MQQINGAIEQLSAGSSMQLPFPALQLPLQKRLDDSLPPASSPPFPFCSRCAITASTMPHFFASSAHMQLFLSVSLPRRATVCPVCFARLPFNVSLTLGSSFAKISTSEACPSLPPRGWWIITLACGRIDLFPSAPAARSTAPILAACPMQIVLTSGLIFFMLS